MAEHDDNIGGLPDVIRESNRPIIIYQGVQPGQIDPVTSNALGLLAWLSMLTICLVIVALSFWSIWNPSHDPDRYSPIYEEGQPRGLANRVDERQQINERADGLLQYLERIQSDNFDRRRTNETHALIDGAGGVDALRREWDAACQRVRARIYDRRIGNFDVQVAEARRQLRQNRDPAQQAALTATIDNLVAQRRAETERRRTNSDPALRCTSAALAPACSRTAREPWCNPDIDQPGEFTGRRSR